MLTGPVICDVAVRDPTTGKWNLIGIFNQVHTASFPSERPLSVYLKLSDAEGTYQLEIRYVQVWTGGQLASATTEIELVDRLGSQDMGVVFPRVPIPEEGKYDFQIWANGMYLGAGGFTARLMSGNQPHA